MNMKLELVAIPVTDIDRAKAFYEKVGFNADHDQTVNENLRFVQLTRAGVGLFDLYRKGIDPDEARLDRSGAASDRECR